MTASTCWNTQRNGAETYLYLPITYENEGRIEGSYVFLRGYDTVSSRGSCNFFLKIFGCLVFLPWFLCFVLFFGCFIYLFFALQTSMLNKHLSSLMPGLTAKVFRTYNASITLQEQLKELTNSRTHQHTPYCHMHFITISIRIKLNTIVLINICV